LLCLVKELQARLPPGDSLKPVPNDLLGFGDAAEDFESNANVAAMPSNALVSVQTSATAAEPESPENNDPVSDLVLAPETSVLAPFTAT